MSRINVAQLFEERKQKLSLTWEAGRGGGNNWLDDDLLAHSTQGVIGHLNFIHRTTDIKRDRD
jgi:HPr kinase/phosphorylase